MRLIIYVLVAILATCSVAWSQSEKVIDCYLGGSLSFPSGSQAMNNEYTTGLNASGSIGYRLSPSFSLILGIHYTSFSVNETVALQEIKQRIFADSGIAGAGISISDGTLTVLSITGDIKFSLPADEGQITPYILLGAGYFSTTSTNITGSYMYSEQTTDVKHDLTPISLDRSRFKVSSALSGSVGAGVDVPISKTNSIFIEGRYVTGLTDDNHITYIPLRLGVRFGLF